MRQTRTRAAALAAVLAALPSCSRPPAEPPEEPTPVTFGVVGVARVRDAAEYLATLKSRRSITLQPQIDGQVVKIFVASGDTVKAGDPIMQIDPARQEALLSSEQATRTARAAALSYWKGQVERLSALYEGGAVSRQELEQARTSYDAARADVEALSAQVRNQEVQLRYYRVAAPAGGVIGDVPVRVGDRVTPATVLTTLSQNQMLEAYVSVPVERAPELRAGLPVEIVPTGGGAPAATQVSFVSPIVSDETQSVLVKAVVGNEGGALRAGQLVRARLVFSEREAPVLPVLAALRLGGQHFAYVVAEDKGALRARQRPVALGAIVEGSYEVRAGLKAGDRVVTSGVQKLRDGALIKAEAPAPAAAPAPALAPAAAPAPAPADGGPGAGPGRSGDVR